MNCYKITQPAEICHFKIITLTGKRNVSVHFTSQDGEVPYVSD